jgi:hypothetical protein
VDEICSAAGWEPHDGLSDRTVVTIMDGKRTLVGICRYCNQPIIAQEPHYYTQLAPVRAHHRTLAPGVWKCPYTGIDHMPARWGPDRVQCIDCQVELTQYRYRDNLTGEETYVFLFEYRIEEDPV